MKWEEKHESMTRSIADLLERLRKHNPANLPDELKRKLQESNENIYKNYHLSLVRNEQTQ